MISLLPSLSGAFQNKVMESSVISTGSGDPGLDGGSEINHSVNALFEYYLVRNISYS